jgi:hypothetical protein
MMAAASRSCDPMAANTLVRRGGDLPGPWACMECGMAFRDVAHDVSASPDSRQVRAVGAHLR